MTTDLIRDLGAGLILRHATPADADALADFNARIHSDIGWETPDLRVSAWTRDLLTRPHPTFRPGDFTIVEDTRTGAIVSSVNLISQTWAFEGIEFGVGRPELVGTHPDYRKRGLVRLQMETVHAWSAERGHKLTAITGIPWYYRQFGYEMTVHLHGGLFGHSGDVPALPADVSEPYRVRPATSDDVDFIAALDAQARERYLLTCVRDAALWRYLIEGMSPGNSVLRQLCVIESAGGEPVGYLAHPNCLWHEALHLTAYELKAGVSWAAVTPSVLRYLKAIGAEYDAYFPRTQPRPPVMGIAFNLGEVHPAYSVASGVLPITRSNYTWYIRVPDLPDFLRTIAPVLEQRLAHSPLVGYSGELRLNFYRSGLRLAFENGRLATVESTAPPTPTWEAACFPDLTFLHLLFGYRNLSELRAAFTDCSAPPEKDQRLLLESLFPKRPSNVWPVE